MILCGRCGKKFNIARSLSQHKRWCTGDERPPAQDETVSSDATGINPTAKENIVKVCQPVQAANEQTFEITSPYVTFCCSYIGCYAAFPTASEYRSHYINSHVPKEETGTIGEKLVEKCISEPRQSTAKTDEVTIISDSDEDAYAKKRQGVTKRKLEAGRSASSDPSSESDSSPISTPKRKLINRSGASRRIQSPASSDSSTPPKAKPACLSSELPPIEVESDDSERSNRLTIDTKSPFSSEHSTPRSTSQRRVPKETAQSVAEKAPETSGLPSVSKRQETPKDPPNIDQDRLEVVRKLLKHANLLSKTHKVLVINFIAGQRVNPYPQKGPIVVIPLDQRTITAEESGKQKDVVRELFLRLNFTTGEYQKIEKEKDASSY